MRRLSVVFSVLAVLASLVSGDKKEKEKKYEGMQKFVSRPDIECPKWNVKVYDQEQVSPGYWFVSPYEKNGERNPGGSWIGPHIYDGNGELVWSGAEMFKHINVMDFKVMTVNDTDVLSMIYAVEGLAYVLDNHYQVQEKVEIGITGLTLNMHDFHSVDNGTRYLFLNRNVTKASEELSETLGYDGECSVTFEGFKEVDVGTQEVRFDWNSSYAVPFSESTLTEAAVNDRCHRHWDYLHSNSIDKFPDGDYLFSARHADTVYKISQKDGSVVWRLGGLQEITPTDFDMGNLNFSRQHHTRVRSQNETHTVLSFLDNARGQDHRTPSSKWTRALLVALRTDVEPMTAEIISSYDHPHHEHSYRRGSYQILPNGHAFICWSERALQSEHTADGKLIMEAQLESPVLGTYRAFKLPFVGEPLTPPDVHSIAVSNGKENKTTTTDVHISWNGATELASWKLYKTDRKGLRSLLVSSKEKTGFETKISYNGYASRVYAEAINRFGETIGQSRVIDTIPPQDMWTDDVAKEVQWLQEMAKTNNESLSKSAKKALTNPMSAFVSGVVFSAVIFLVISCIRKRGARVPWIRSARFSRYAPVDAGDAAEYDETKLDEMRPHVKRSRSGMENPDAFALGDEEDVDVGYHGQEKLNTRVPFMRQTSGA